MSKDQPLFSSSNKQFQKTCNNAVSEAFLGLRVNSNTKNEKLNLRLPSLFYQPQVPLPGRFGMRSLLYKPQVNFKKKLELKKLALDGDLEMSWTAPNYNKSIGLRGNFKVRDFITGKINKKTDKKKKGDKDEIQTEEKINESQLEQSTLDLQSNNLKKIDMEEASINTISQNRFGQFKSILSNIEKIQYNISHKVNQGTSLSFDFMLQPHKTVDLIMKFTNIFKPNQHNFDFLMQTYLSENLMFGYYQKFKGFYPRIMKAQQLNMGLQYKFNNVFTGMMTYNADYSRPTVQQLDNISLAIVSKKLNGFLTATEIKCFFFTNPGLRLMNRFSFNHITAKTGVIYYLNKTDTVSFRLSTDGSAFLLHKQKLSDNVTFALSARVKSNKYTLFNYDSGISFDVNL
eukprot:403343969